jgi:plastocyanin
MFYSPYYYPRMYYAPSYTSGYGFYMMPYASGYGSYQMPYTSGYGSYQMPSAGSYGSIYSGGLAEINAGLHDYYFYPNPINVPVGTIVRWTNSGQHRHTVTSDADLWDSGELNPGESYTYTFTTTGTYPYHCSIHPEMRGVVIVK